MGIPLKGDFFITENPLEYDSNLMDLGLRSPFVRKETNPVVFLRGPQTRVHKRSLMADVLGENEGSAVPFLNSSG